MNLSTILAQFHTLRHAIGAFIRLHKVWSLIIGAVILYGAYTAYGALTALPTATRYVTSTVATGTVVATLSETGQVSASHQIALTPKGSGQIVGIYAKPGAQVAAGQLLVALDASDAQTALTDAKLSLETAELTYQQNTASSTLALSLLQAQNGVTNGQTSLQKAHDDAYASIAGVYTDFSSVISGLDSVLHDSNVQGRTNEQNISAYRDIVANQDTSIGIYASSAETSYSAAVAAYNSALTTYKATNRTASNDDLIALAQTTYEAAQAVADAVRNTHDFYDRVNTDYSLYNLGSSSALAALLSSVSGYTTTMNSDLSDALSDKTNIVTAKQALAVAENSLDSTQGSGTTLTMQSAALSLKKAQEAVTSAEQALADYYVRAPFPGTVASVPVQLYDQAGSGTTVATVVTSQDTLDISVNEIDASKIQVGQKATITFDALPDVTVAGTVASIDSIGTVSQGVVSYDAVITFDTENSQVKPGMSASADIIIGSETGLVVPSSAVKTTGGASYVQVFNPPLPADAVAQAGSGGVVSDTAPARVPVTTGLAGDTEVIIESGLAGGEQIVTRSVAATTVGATATAPSATSLLGGSARAGGTATFRAGGGGGAATLGR